MPGHRAAGLLSELTILGRTEGAAGPSAQPLADYCARVLKSERARGRAGNGDRAEREQLRVTASTTLRLGVEFHPKEQRHQSDHKSLETTPAMSRPLRGNLAYHPIFGVPCRRALPAAIGTG